MNSDERRPISFDLSVSRITGLQVNGHNDVVAVYVDGFRRFVPEPTEEDDDEQL